MWGPVESLQQVHAQQPPLIGNRRQGPDLAQVGARRSPFWLKAHLIAPRELSGGSIMPSFAFLFRDERGDDLVAYLVSLKSGDDQQRSLRKSWAPVASAVASASAAEGEYIYRQQCATCHEDNGSARRQFRTQFRDQPTNLFKGPYQYLHPSGDTNPQLSRISKFGIPGTDMPGHEYLSDRQIASLTLFLTQSSHHP
jgi:cytochrome c oxidase cbb3-type subunit 2